MPFYGLVKILTEFDLFFHVFLLSPIFLNLF